MQKIKINHIIIALLLLCFFSQATFCQNQVLTVQDNIKVPNITTDAQKDALTVTGKQTAYQYYDGYGRVVETNGYHASPLQQDLVQPVGYNSIGQQTTSYLPYTDGLTDGSFRGGAAATGQATFYNNTTTYLVARDNSPYSSQVFENSPLQRLLSAGMVGDGFQPGGTGTQHYKTVTYRSNNATADGNIFVWYPDGTYIPGTLYGDNSLVVTDGKDEDNVETLSYTDLGGHTILKRQVHAGGNLDTYYVYNASGMISYIVPPKATAALAANSYSLTAAAISTQIFSFTYDGRGRLISKTVPAKGTMYIVYDAWNRPVLMQDANMKAGNKWNYIKYDVKGRAISQGIYVDATYITQATMQSYVNTLTTVWYESRSGTLTNGGYYTNTAFPTTGTPLAYGYYDNYDLNQDGTDDFSYVTQSDVNLSNEESATTTKLRGVPTIVSKTTMGLGIAANTWLTTATFYDKRGNPIQVRSNNHVYYTGATTFTDTKTVVPDFTGVPQVSKVVKQTGASTTVTVYTALTYDHMYRVTGVSQKYNTGAMQAVAAYTYNEIGQVIKKGVGYVNSTTWLQNIDMRYNIRGQLLTINNSTLTNDMTTNKTNGDTNDVFGMQLLYNVADAGIGNTALFNGKLSAVKWMSKDGSGTATRERSYKYTYDDIDRYTAENYGERTTAGTGSFNQNPNGFDEYGITYDAGGNITHLNRKSSTVGGSTNTLIDNLTYSYDPTNPDQLKSVADAGTSAGFVGGSGNYVYDTNGNLITDPYKGLALSYNNLNRTDNIVISSNGNTIYYTYDASGTLLRKQVYTGIIMRTLQSTTDYVDGFVYIAAGSGASALSYFPMPEGRVLYNAGTFTQEFIITDQQGNARVSFQNNAGTAKVYQENSYYGYGMAFLTSPVSLPTTPNKRLYNGGSEWQNDYNNLPDYYQTFYRNYDAALGRFVGVDPMAEVTESLSTYHYAGNNPITYNDPNGDFNIDPFSPGFNMQVGNPWAEQNGFVSSTSRSGSSSGYGGSSGGSYGDGYGEVYGGSSSGVSDPGSGGGSNASFYASLNAALTGDPLAIEQYAAANAMRLPDGTLASFVRVRTQRYGTGYGDDITWQGSDVYFTQRSANQGGGAMLGNAHIFGFFDTKGIGSNYSGNVAGLGFSAIVTTYDSDGEESVRVIPVVISEANFSVPKFRSANKNIAPMDKTLASLLFQMSYNNAVDEMDALLHSGLAPRLQTISEYELKTDFINLIKANMTYNIPGSSFNGYYVKGAASNIVVP